MTEKGFATIFGLCLILVIALIVKGIQESEMNYAYETADFKLEFDLQNAADSGIYEAAKYVQTEIAKGNLEVLPINRTMGGERKKYQKKLPSKTISSPSGSIKVEVWGERIVINPYEINYKRKTNNKYNAYAFFDENDKKIYLKGCAFLSVATFTDKSTGEKRYRRSYAYLLESSIRDIGGKIVEENFVSEEEKKVIHFMEINKENLHYLEIKNPDRN